MPTGYTAIIEDKKDVTFRDYILGCARAFGACISMRDEPMDRPLPKELKVDPYHIKELEKQHQEFRVLNNYTEKQLEKKASNEFNREVRKLKQGHTEAIEKESRYAKILEEVEAWLPPTKDHNELKNFMRQQIQTSTEYVHTDYYQKELLELKILTGKQWFTKELARINKDIKYHNKEYKEEEARIKNRSDWLKALWKSLK